MSAPPGGKVSDGSVPLLTGGDERQSEEEEEGVETGSDRTPPTSNETNEQPQYSPSVSHDEEEQWEAVEGGGLEKRTGKTSLTSIKRGSRKPDPLSEPSFEGGEEEEDEWEGFGTESGWGEEGTSISTEDSETKSASGGGEGRANESEMANNSIEKRQVTSEEDGKPAPSTGRGALASRSTDSLRGRLKDEDIQRLEVQAAWRHAEPDFFADMEPSIPTGTGSSVEDRGGGEGERKDSASMTNGRDTGASSSSVSLKYTPSGQDEVSGWVYVAGLLSQTVGNIGH